MGLIQTLWSEKNIDIGIHSFFYLAWPLFVIYSMHLRYVIGNSIEFYNVVKFWYTYIYIYI